MTRTPIAASIAALFLLTASSAFAQTSGTTANKAAAGTSAAAPSAPATSASSTKSSAMNGDTKPASKLSHGDRKFIEEAAEGGLLEVELGRLASDKASDPAVKQFGERMVRDHSDANKKLMDLAQTKGVNPTGNVKKSDQRSIDKLAKRSGSDFDRAYMDMMVKDHKKDVKDFQKEAKSKDSDVAQFAGATLPTLQEHLQLAQSTQQQVKTAKRSASTGAAASSSASSGASTGASTTAASAPRANTAGSTSAMTSTSTNSPAAK